jgi:hypothetical protein
MQQASPLLIEKKKKTAKKAHWTYSEIAISFEMSVAAVHSNLLGFIPQKF